MKIIKPAQLFLYLQKLNGVKRGPLLGLDVGMKHIGVSISDNELKVADPLRVLSKDSNANAELHKLVSYHSLSGFIIGKPMYKLKPSTSFEQVQKFVKEATDTGNFADMHACYWNETGTSQNVTLMFKGLGLDPALEKSVNDMLAAVAILQGYLDYHNSDKTKTNPWTGEFNPKSSDDCNGEPPAASNLCTPSSTPPVLDDCSCNYTSDAISKRG